MFARVCVCGSLSTWINWIEKWRFFFLIYIDYVMLHMAYKPFLRPIPPHTLQYQRCFSILSVPTPHTGFRRLAPWYFPFYYFRTINIVLYWLPVNISWYRRHSVLNDLTSFFFCFNVLLWQCLPSSRFDKTLYYRPWLIEYFQREITTQRNKKQNENIIKTHHHLSSCLHKDRKHLSLLLLARRYWMCVNIWNT